jgi:broad specificity phosphatase PhoE
LHLFIIRHGECLGQIDPQAFADKDSALSPLGERQARLTGQRLKMIGLTHIVSSPLIRALHTASLIAEVVENCPVEVWPELREVNMSVYNGLDALELGKRFPKATLLTGLTADYTYGGDTYAGLFVRAEQILQRLRQQFKHDDQVALITHGGFANYLLHAILNIQPDTPQWFELANCSISLVRFVPNPEERPNWPLFPPVQAEILSINDIAHLASLLNA